LAWFGPWTGGGERRLRQAGRAARATVALTARLRWPGPQLRCVLRPAVHRPAGTAARIGDSTPSSRRSSRPGNRSMTDPMSSSSRGSTRVRPSCTPAGSTRRWPRRSTLTSCWSPAGRPLAGPRAPSSVWPSRLLSPPAVTGRVSAPAWSAAWSTACRRRTWRRPRSWARRWPGTATPHRAVPHRPELTWLRVRDLVREVAAGAQRG